MIHTGFTLQNRHFSSYTSHSTMASDHDTTAAIFSSMHEDDDGDEEDDHLHLHHHYPSHTMSRLSICTSNSKHSMSDDDDDDDDDVDDDDDMIMDVSRLYVGSESEEEEEADGELSGKEGSVGSEMGWFSQPASPMGGVGREVKEYASENEGKRGGGRRGERRVMRERWLEKAWEMKKCKAADEEVESDSYPSGESEPVVLIARPKGGGRSLWMDMEEVKACRELGFDLQHEWTLEIPSTFSASSAVDTDSGSNSPIANWKISAAGDDPKDVKARLKVWAQAVALASTHHLTG